jgi:hypothetical protein
MAYVVRSTNLNQRLSRLPPAYSLSDLMWRKSKLPTKPDSSGLSTLTSFVGLP